MTEDPAPVPREVIDGIVAELERLMDDARDKWTLPKRDNPTHTAAWSSRELGYRDALQLLADAGLAVPAVHGIDGRHVGKLDSGRGELHR